MNTKQSIHDAGGVSTVAREFGISPVSVYEWISKARIPADRVIPLCRLGNWKHTPHELDPVIYPHSHDGLPEEIKAALIEADRRSSRERRRWAERRAKERLESATADLVQP